MSSTGVAVPAVAVAFHGTSRSAAEAVLGGAGFRSSTSRYEWLGDGVYFFQDGPLLARRWAQERHEADAAVLQAQISLADCLDLVDMGWWQFLRDVYDGVLADLDGRAGPRPLQRGAAHGIDCAVVNLACRLLEEQSGVRVRSVRAVFTEGTPAGPNSAFFSLSHIQICVRDLSVVSDVRLWEE